MLSVSSGNSISITFIHGINGQASLSGISYKLTDVTGATLIPDTEVPDFNTAEQESTVLIPAEFNTITNKFDARVVEATYTGSDGSLTKTSVFYEIVGDVVKLTPMLDSFMYFPESFFIRKRIIEPMVYYDELSDTNKALALTAAFEKLVTLKFNVDGVKTDLSTTTAEQLSGMDPKFVEALKLAQMVEANNLVENNPVKDKVRMGIISETIGESSMFFKQKGLDAPSYYSGISDDAYPYLSKYLWKSTSNGQVWRLRRS